MATIKKHVASFPDHYRVDLYNALTDKMERISALYDAFELFAMDMSEQATLDRFTIYEKLAGYLHNVDELASELARNARTTCQSIKDNCKQMRKQLKIE